MNIQRKIIIVWAISLLIVISCHGQNYTVHFGYDANGNRVSRTLTVAKTEQNFNPSDTIATVESIVATVNSFGNAILSVYPNPTNKRLIVSLQGLCESPVTACIVTTAGTILQQRNLSEGIHDFDLSNLSSGMYLLRLASQNVTQTWKIIKN